MHTPLATQQPSATRPSASQPPSAAGTATSANPPGERFVHTWAHASSRAVHPSSHTGDEPLVRVIAAGLAAVSMPWELTDATIPTERCYELLLSTDSYDAWLIHWPPGTGVAAHDHGGSTGAFAVVSGVLDEDVEMDDHTTTRRLHTGESVVFQGDHVHAVVNRGEIGATSVHVYSPPLRSMAFYGESPDGGRIVERVEQIDAAHVVSR